VLDILFDLKASMHDVANTSAADELDNAIVIVQQCIDSGSSDEDITQRVIAVIGKVIDKLPSIAALLKMLSD
jgi:hypothetical protein